MASTEPIDIEKHRYPYCIVWTPIPLLTWLFPFIGHMGIATSTGVIRDFAGSYFVSEDNMAFGSPTKYLQLDITKVPGGVTAWDRAISQASDEYTNHVHNLCCDNCHSHVALALNTMSYPGKRDWNMISLAWQLLVHGKFVNFSGFGKTWLPFLIFVTIIVLVAVFVD